MKKYDCSKTLDCGHELIRLCKAMPSPGGCNRCKLTGLSCHEFGDITQEKIDIIQKWSDEHPERTRCDAFLEKYPNAKVRAKRVLMISPCELDSNYDLNGKCDMPNCIKCAQEYWTAPADE